MYMFDFSRPASIQEAVALLSEDSEAKLLSGGQSLLPMMKQRLAQPSRLIDLSAIDGLRGIESVNDRLAFGALVRHCEVATSSVVAAVLPALAGLAGGIGDVQVRHRGTIGGSVSNNDPAADYPAACLALGATIMTDRRRIEADEFFVDMFETALEQDEIVVRIEFPVPRFAAYRKFQHPISRYALVGVFIARFDEDVRVAVTGAASCAFRLEAFERALTERWSTAALETIDVEADNLNQDMHASSAYRAHMIRHLALDILACEKQEPRDRP